MVSRIAIFFKYFEEFLGEPSIREDRVLQQMFLEITFKRDYRYVRKNVMRVQSPGVGDLDDLTINQIRHISISPSERTMGVTTLRTELYIIKILVEQDLDKVIFLLKLEPH